MNEVYKITREELEDIADSIRAKTGESNLMTVSEMPGEIASISGGGGDSGETYGNIGSPIKMKYGKFEQTCGIAMPASKWSYVQDTEDEPRISSNLAIDANAPCLLLACAMHRSNVSIDNNNSWTRVVESASIDPATINQRITVWAKTVQAGRYEATITCATSGRIAMKMICLYDAASLTVQGNTLISSVPYTPPMKSDKRRLYLLSSALANPSVSPVAVTVSDIGALDLKSAEELRFSVFYDYQPTIITVPKFSYFEVSNDIGNYTENYMNALTIDITEV